MQCGYGKNTWIRFNLSSILIEIVCFQKPVFLILELKTENSWIVCFIKQMYLEKINISNTQRSKLLLFWYINEKIWDCLWWVEFTRIDSIR